MQFSGQIDKKAVDQTVEHIFFADERVIKFVIELGEKTFSFFFNIQKIRKVDVDAKIFEIIGVVHGKCAVAVHHASGMSVPILRSVRRKEDQAPRAAKYGRLAVGQRVGGFGVNEQIEFI